MSPLEAKVTFAPKPFRDGHSFAPTDERYSLLPFKFLQLDEDRYIATSIGGDFVVIGKSDLYRFVNHELQSNEPIYEELKSKHLLLDSDSTTAIDLLAIKLRSKHAGLKQLTGLFMFVVTLRCEHSCPYCQVSRRSSDRSAFDMSIEDASAAIDLVFQSPAEQIKIEFQGGEPLLNFDLIKYIVTEISSRNQTHKKDIAFVIATNLALISDEILDFCKANSIGISTSLDGPEELHNANRPRPEKNSYELTIRGIEKVRNWLGEDSVSALMTTTRASLSIPEQIIDEYLKQGFRSIFLRSLSPYGFAVKTGAIRSYDSLEWLEFYKRSLAYIISLNRNGIDFQESFSAIILRKIFTPFASTYVDLQSPSGIGLSCMAFNYDGRIFASDEARMLAEMGDETFLLGRLRDRKSLVSLLTESGILEIISSSMVEAMPMCSDCGVQPYCGSDPVFHHATQADAIGLKTKSGYCNKNMEAIKHLFILMTGDKETERLFRRWAY